MRPAHVLHVIKGLGRGGAETLLSHAQRHVDREAFRLSFVYFLERKSTLVKELRSLGAEVTLIDTPGPAAASTAVSRLTRHLDEHQVDLIHAHLPLAAVAARMAGERARVPVIYTEHNLHERHRRATRWLNRLTWKRQRLVLAVSEAVKESIARHQSSSVPVRVVANGVPVERLRPDPAAGQAFRQRWQIPEEARLIGQIAVFRPEKRLDRWLEVAARLRATDPTYRFVLIGDGPEREALRRHTARLGLEAAVHFTGLQEDVRPALAALDIHLITSRFEGLPLVLLESMATATPAVATEVGGISEAVVDGETGLLLPADASVETIASAVHELARDPERSARLGSAAAERVRARYSAAAWQRRLEKIYREVLA